MSVFDWTFPYPSRRMPVLADNVVATSQPLAAQAGLRMLLRGGNAADAALATAIALTVVEPTSSGIGSDAFCILWDGSQLHGLNASGRSPAALTPEHFVGRDAIPVVGWDPVTVPGAVSAWAEVSRRFGRLPFADLFAPAIEYASEGYPASPVTAAAWANAPQAYGQFESFMQTFCPNGRAPLPGERIRLPDHARTLTQIAESNGEAFYRGELAERIEAHARETGGLLTADDMAAHQADWVGTASVDYRGLTLHEIPPNGQGLAALIALGILEHHPLTDCPADSADSLHLQIEAMKLAFADGHRYIADPDHMDVTVESLLDRAYLEERAALIDMSKAGEPGPGVPHDHGTVYLTAADRDGMMVSFIQSNYYGFGSGIVVPGTGIALQDRGCGFTLEPGHPNQVGPGKRPYHTIIPAFVTRDGEPPVVSEGHSPRVEPPVESESQKARVEPWMSFGVMGGPMQPQGHLQMMVRIAGHGQNPQAAADAPRWQVRCGERDVIVEEGVGREVIDQLIARGHRVSAGLPTAFGGAQLIAKLPDGGYVAASEPRKDGQAVGF
jgi:gamma-glutamyltranspeptidase / glutathione hydrolase